MFTGTGSLGYKLFYEIKEKVGRGEVERYGERKEVDDLGDLGVIFRGREVYRVERKERRGR